MNFGQSVAYLRGSLYPMQMRSFLQACIKTGYDPLEVHFIEEEEEGYHMFDEMVTGLLTTQGAPRVIVVPTPEDLSYSEEVQRLLLCYLASKGIKVIQVTGAYGISEDKQSYGLQVSTKDLSESLPPEMIKAFALTSHIDKQVNFTGLLPEDVDQLLTAGSRPRGAPGYHRERPEVVRLIKSMRRKKKGQARRPTLQAIADALNEKGLTTMRGKLWTRQSVQRILASSKTKTVRIGDGLSDDALLSLDSDRLRAGVSVPERNFDELDRYVVDDEEW